LEASRFPRGSHRPGDAATEGPGLTPPPAECVDRNGNPMDTSSSTRWDTGLYDGKHSFVWKHGASLVELIAPRPGERVLDLGCGTGHLTARIAEAGADVVGIDASAEMVEQAR
jgi:2-polyprenyl-3-methyl-5-hydroxy-6-metoxy-1,4-benzoquinol methylase